MNQRFLKTGLLSTLALLVWTGCPGDEPANNNPSTDMNMPDDMTMADMADMAVDMTGDDGMTTPDMDKDMGDMACVPKTSCEPDACGIQEDGCSGTIDCGACACVGGQPAEPTCGICGFGRSGCEMATGDGPATCSLPEWTVTPSDCDTIVYVDAGNTQPGQDGSRENPFSELDQVLNAANMSSASMIALRTGSYTASGRLILKEGRHMVGGFGEGFIFDEEGSSSITITPSGPGDERIGVEAIDLEEKTWLKQLDITVEGVNAPLTLYGAHVVGSPGLHLEEVTITTGPLGDGSSGKDGEDGANGGDGGDAESIVTLSRRIGDMTMGGYVNGAFAGAAGTNPDCPAQANGGAGGEGIHIIATEIAVSPFVEYMRVLPQAGFANSVGLNGGDSGSSMSPTGTNGASGTAGVSGNNGNSGVSQGSVVRTYWVANGNGEDGQDGDTGTGGSGGGGTWWMDERPNLQDSKPGASGGGGGAGGCGGEGGKGGQAGATGFGVLLVESSGVVFDRVTVQGPDAGNGGNGGSGGSGGIGGVGGGGSEQYATTATSTPVAHPLNAGRGGTGGQGSTGGLGGAGAGGSSFGVYCDTGSSVERVGDVTALAGQAGAGGALGSLPGENGQSEDVVACW